MAKRLKYLHAAKVYSDHLYTRFAFLLCLFVLTVCISASIYQTLEKNDSSAYTLDTVVANFSQRYNVSASDVEILLSDVGKVKDNHSMTFFEAFVLVVSLFTTVGWGHVVLTTQASHVFTIFVGGIGIPLTLFLVVTGGRIANEVVFKLVKLSMTYHNEQLNEYCAMKNLIAARRWHLPALACLLATYILLLTPVVMVVDRMSFLRSLYFVCVALTTVGFGDVTQQQMMRHEGQHGYQALHALFLLIWLLFGIILVSAIIINAATYKKKRQFQTPTIDYTKGSDACLSHPLDEKKQDEQM